MQSPREPVCEFHRIPIVTYDTGVMTCLRCTIERKQALVDMRNVMVRIELSKDDDIHVSIEKNYIETNELDSDYI